MDRTLIILNPSARGAKGGTLSAKISRLCGDTPIRTTCGAGEARTIAKEAVREGFTTIIAAGGDGTINEVVNGIAGSGVTLGVLPIGTMNVFALELGLPVLSLSRCWKVIQAGHVRRIDLPKANTRYFVQLAGIGFDAQVVKNTSFDFKKTFGPLSYLISATQIASHKPPRLLVESDGTTQEGSFALIGNGRFYGGPFVIFKNAQIDDGKLDVLIFKNLGYLDIVRYLNAIIFGAHHKLPDVEYFQTTSARVRSDENVPVEVDGDVIGNVPVTFSLSRRKLRVLTPG